MAENLRLHEDPHRRGSLRSWGSWGLWGALAWAVVLLGSLAALRTWHARFADYVYEDAFIAYRFSDNWARGLGPTWNAGEDPVEGFTSPLWVALGAAGEWLFGVMPDATMPVLGVLSWLALVLLILPWAATRLSSGSSPRLTAALLLVAALAIAAAAPLALQIWAGLETTAFVALLTWTIAYAAVVTPSRAGYLGLATLSMLTISVRPDAVAALGPAWLLAVWRRDPVARWHAFTGAAALAGMLAVYVAVRAAYYGHLLPNTFNVKHGGWTAGAVQVGYFLERIWWMPAAWLVLIGLDRGRLLRDRAFLCLALAAILFTAAYLRIEPMQAWAFRFLIPTLPLWVLATVRAVAVLAGRESAAWRRVVAVALGVASIVATTVGLELFYRSDQGRLRGFFHNVRDFHVPVSRALGDLSDLEPPPVLGTADVGAFPYYTHMPTLDLAGLCDEHIARHGLTHDYLTAHKPDVLLLQDLPLTRSKETAERDSTGLADLPVFEVGGTLWTIDKRRHRQLPADFSKVHSGLATSYIVATMPGFASEYEHVATMAFRGYDTYEFFVRTAYPARDELVRRLRAALPRRGQAAR